MNIDSYLLDKLSKILFLEIKKGTKLGNYEFKENIYLPVKSEDVVGKAKDGDDLKNIPITLFLEGIFFVLGCDNNFKYNNEYKDIVMNIDGSLKFIKGNIFKNIKESKYEDAYILLKGLIKVEKLNTNYDKAFLLLEALRNTKLVFKEEELKLIDECKKIIGFSTPYLYEAIIKKEDNDYKLSLVALNEYLNLNGEKTNEVIELKDSLEIITSYNKGKEMVYSEPKEALKILLPLMDKLSDTVEIYYYIAVANRMLENYEKAIYYLNEAQMINNDDISVVNEMGINYASLGNYDSAIKYFRAAFEVTKAIDICTNLIMCYINIGDLKQVKLHIEIAEKLDSNDEVLKEIKSMLKDVQL
ncbi:tetratricopeptide repeat protein [Clostridium ihumii]|uniref:tetratricopeptide repeat protein n=1 Tax=Clostridium ihumii TaxID=1470356 RepID=UPI003D32A55B